jgi:hypothetical protein
MSKEDDEAKRRDDERVIQQGLAQSSCCLPRVTRLAVCPPAPLLPLVQEEGASSWGCFKNPPPTTP